jgi:hypothetical protein
MSPRADRGQTTIDYAVGISVFLLTVAFIFAFLPSMFEPFTSESGDLLVLADRSADRLAADLLVENLTDPNVLNATCTVGFFNATAPDPTGCRYNQNASDIRGALSVNRTGAEFNITVRDAGALRTVDETDLAAGDDPPSTGDVTVATRKVLLDGNQSDLVVKVW